MSVPSRFPRGAWRLAATLAALAWTPLAHAVPFVWAFEAESTVIPGARISGRVTLESSVPDDDALPTFGRYLDAVIGFEGSANGQPVLYDGANPGFVVVNVDPELADLGAPNLYWVIVPVLDVAGNAGLVTVELADSSRLLIDDDRLRVVPPPLSELDPFDPAALEGTGITTQSLVSVYGLGASVITSLYLVPEPSTGTLAGLGVAAALALRRRQDSRSR